MRKLHYIILTFVACFMLSIRPAQAQTTDGYLTTGDIVSISYKQYPWGGDLPKPKYMSVEGGVITSVEDVTSSCLFQVFIEEVNGFYYYIFKLLDKEQYLKVNNNANGGQEGVLELVDSLFAASGFQISKANNNAERSYLYGQLSSSVKTSWGEIKPIYLTTDFRLAGWNPVSLYIEKWEQEGANAPKGRFYPESIILPYAVTEQELSNQTVDVTFTLPTQIVISYTCLNQPDLVIGGGQGDVDYNDITNLKFYWESTGDNKEVTSKISPSLYYDDPNDSYELPDEGTAVLSLTTGATNGASTTFTITPVGESPMNLRTNTNSRIQWVNYADRVVAEYKYKGDTVKQTMRVVRNSYHEEPLPPLTFHINPTMFTFGADAETVNITVVPIHQHGSVIYDVNQNVFKTEYEPHDPAYPEQLTLTSETDGWVITTDDGADWLSHTVNTNSIAITAEALGNGQSDRTATFTGTFQRENAGSGHEHQESFTIQLAQRSDAGIQFNKENQEVHTATRTIYYLPEDKIELRLAESNFFGYMRWYDYHTDKAPNYNFGNDNFGNDYDYATSWYTTPRGANNQPFTPINTPASAATESAEGRSWGLYAINHHHGGILNEGTENSNNIPVLNGWNYTYTKGQTYSTEQEKRAAGYHTIACDVSAYTDYVITKDDETGLVASITEPTLSYRQLFDLRPAGEMADKLAALESGEYLEEYHYQAPAGKNILLTPQFKYRKTNDEYLSKLCYFYWNDENLVRVENATWSGDNIISDNGEYLTISGNAGETKTYTLTANGGAVRIAKFTVTFTNPQETGPSRMVLKSDYEIENIYSRKAHIDFNYTDDSIKTTLSDGFTYYNQPLDAAESTYGFVYTQGDLAQTASNTHHGFVRAANQGVFPFYGEYVLVNGVNKSWNEAGISAENHGGKDKGFALYVDGTTEPGLVVSISAPANICSGQTMYCSAWLCNPSNTAHQGSNPIFRFNVQGREKDENGNYGKWEDAGVFFVGELPKGSGWQQVVFPIESAHSYDSTRVSLYNFATSGAANDFLVDDISLFVSQLPIAAYQGKMACRTTANEATNAAAVLRIDYGKINAGADGYMYYQIYNESYNDNVGAPMQLTGNAAYYHEYDEDHLLGDYDHAYGSIHIPTADFDPIKENEKLNEENEKLNEKKDTLLIYYSVSKFLDDLAASGDKHGKAYVKTENNGVVKWLLYVAHIIENITDLDDDEDESTKQLPLQYLYDKHTYSMRMAYDPDELEVENCNLTTPLHATQQTVFTLRNSNGETIEHINDDGVLTATKEKNSENVKYIFDNSKGNCANDLYFLTAKIVNHMAAKGGASIGEVSAPIYADWLVGDENLDAILENTGTSPEEKEAEFAKKYNNYTPGQVTTAIMYDMRRNDPANPNYEAKSFEELDPSAFLSQQNYDIIRHLCDSGWLQFRDTTIHFYLAPDAKASYWCFPIEGTAKTTVKDENGEMEVTIKDCNEPRRVVITAASSEHYLNIAPLEQAKKTTPQKLQLPKVNVLQPREGNLTTVTIPVCKNTADQYDQYYEIGSNTKVDGLTENKITIRLSEATFFDLEKGEPYKTRPTLEVGEEYTLRLQLKDNNGNINISDENSCRIGYVFATIQIVPNTLVWQPTGHSFNGWGKNENWKGWKDDNSNGVIEDGELITGYVPMEGADVVIPALNNPLLYPYIVPEHDHDHYPMTVHHDQHKCRYIYLAPGAYLNNQHLLDYEKAFVDMPIPKGNWYMMSSPLQDMYSGDMYIPHSGSSFEDNNAQNHESTQPFQVASFQGKRSSQGPYAFWASYYNQAVKTYYDNGIYTETSAVAAEFQSSNSLVQPLPIGSGFMLWGEGPDNMESDTLVVRLPKPDTYYTSSGGHMYYPQSRENVHKFAFTANHEVDHMQITLTNEAGSEYFLFGNPTMAFINMHDFLHDNEAVLNHVFYRIENGAWDAATELTMSNDRFLAPMTSVMLETKDKAQETSLSVTLKASHLTLNNQVNPFSEDNPAVSPVAPRRSSNADTQASTSNKHTSEIMTIYAFTQDAQARTVVAANPLAYDYYQVGEDAIFISSGVENQSYVTTPLNMYTVAEQVPMMADVRQGISNIPLAMLIHDDCRTQHMQLAFYLSPNWTRKCYLHDTATGQKMRIMDGLVITVDMPQNHEQRYIIEGPDQYIGSNNNDSTTTSVENNLSANADEATVHAYSVEKGTLTVLSNQLIEQVKVYNLTGQLMLTHRPSLLSYQLSTNAQLPTGVCVVEATLHNGATLYTQTIVK